VLERRGPVAGDELAERRAAVVADRGLEAHWDSLDRTELLEPLRLDPRLARQLLGRGVAAQGGGQLALLGSQLGELLPDVDRDPDRARVLLDGALHRLPDPPGGVGRELEPPPVVELLDRADQPQDPLLDQVEEGKAEPPVALRVRDHEPDVRLDHPALRLLVAALDPAGKLHLLGGGQQAMLRDVAEE
jgi:hypothetical protein